MSKKLCLPSRSEKWKQSTTLILMRVNFAIKIYWVCIFSNNVFVQILTQSHSLVTEHDHTKVLEIKIVMITF